MNHSAIFFLFLLLLTFWSPIIPGKAIIDDNNDDDVPHEYQHPNIEEELLNFRVKDVLDLLNNNSLDRVDDENNPATVYSNVLLQESLQFILKTLRHRLLLQQHQQRHHHQQQQQQQQRQQREVISQEEREITEEEEEEEEQEELIKDLDLEDKQVINRNTFQDSHQGRPLSTPVKETSPKLLRRLLASLTQPILRIHQLLSFISPSYKIFFLILESIHKPFLEAFQHMKNPFQSFFSKFPGLLTNQTRKFSALRSRLPSLPSFTIPTSSGLGAPKILSRLQASLTTSKRWQGLKELMEAIHRQMKKDFEDFQRFLGKIFPSLINKMINHQQQLEEK